MTARVIPLPRAASKSEPNAFAFTKSALNDRTANAPDDGKQIIFRDTQTRGLIVRRQKRDWVVAIERKIDGKIWRITLGEYGPRTDIKAIRAEAETIMSEIRRGTYVAAKVKAVEARAASGLAAMTIGDALDLHRKVNPQVRDSTIESYAYSVLNLVDLPAPTDANGKADPMAGVVAIRTRMLDIDTPMVRDAYDRLCEVKSPATGNRMLRSVRAIWNTWADEAEIDTRNPVTRITAKRGRVAKVKPRSGALTPAQRADWWAALDRLARTSASFNTARALQFLFLTGMRRDEVLHMSWDEVDMKAGEITIPASRMKAGTELTRPITPGMRAVLDEQARMNPNSPWVFPASRGTGPVRDTRKVLLKLPTVVTNHDLRRGYIVAAELAGVSAVATKMLVGHSTTDVTEEYARAIGSELPAIAGKIEAELMP